MTELHVWAYAGLVIITITIALLWQAIEHDNRQKGVNNNLTILFALLPAVIYISGAGLRIAVFVVMWMLAPLAGGQ